MISRYNKKSQSSDKTAYVDLKDCPYLGFLTLFYF